MLQHY